MTNIFLIPSCAIQAKMILFVEALQKNKRYETFLTYGEEEYKVLKKEDKELY